jgi:hypothetical protein
MLFLDSAIHLFAFVDEASSGNHGVQEADTPIETAINRRR